MARRKDHTPQELHELILTGAQQIVEEQGFSALTARRIAARIGYTPGTIYNFFKSMDALSLAINGQTLDMLQDALSAPECNDPLKPTVWNMKAMARHYLDFAKENRALWLMLFTYVQPDTLEIPDWYTDKIQKLFVPLQVLLQNDLCPSAHEARKTARVLWASVHGIVFLEGTGKISRVAGQSTALELVDLMIENFVRGLSAQDPAR